MNTKNLFSIIILLFVFENGVKAQETGISLGYSGENAVFGDIFYKLNDQSFHFGGTYGINDQLGKYVTEQKPNYGRTVLKTDNYIWTIDIGYNKYINNLFFGPELSIGATVDYTNFEDGRFNDDGYHMRESEFTAGIGATIGYQISNDFSLYINYNTVRSFGLAMRINFDITQAM